MRYHLLREEFHRIQCKLVLHAAKIHKRYELVDPQKTIHVLYSSNYLIRVTDNGWAFGIQDIVSELLHGRTKLSIRAVLF